MKFRKNVLCSIILLSLLFSVFGLVNSNGKTNQSFEGRLSVLATDSYFDSFDGTLYEDPSTTAWGWGTGTLSVNRDFESFLLDFYPTSYPVRDLVVQGRKAYLSCQNFGGPTETLQIVNLTNIYDMKTIGIRNAATGMNAIDINGDTLLVGVVFTPERMNSYNVTFPANIDAGVGAFLSNINFDGYVNDIQIDGHLAFVAVNSSISNRSLRIVDCSDPRNLIEIQNNWASSTTTGLYIHGGLGYLAESNRGFYLVNLTSRATIGEIGHVDTPGIATDVIADGNYVYVADHENGVVIIDTSTLSNPIIVGHYDTPGQAWRLAKIGTTLFVADGDGGVQVLDVANPNNPIRITSITLTSFVFDVELYGGDLLIGTADGMYAYRIGGGMSDLSTDIFYNHYDDFEVWDVRVWGSVAYIAGGPDGFYTLDVSDPMDVVLLDHYSVPIGINFKKLDVDGPIAYLVDEEELYVFEVADPTNIRLINHLYGFSFTDIYADGELFYLTTLVGFVIVNMTIPHNPDVILDYNMGGVNNLTAIWVQGPNLHVVDYLGASGVSIYVYNILDMTNPILTDTVFQPGYFWDVYVDGDMAYYGCEDQMFVYNVSNPTQVSQYGYTSLNSMGVWGFGPYILSADSTDGVSLVNNTNPNEQIVESQYADATGALQVTIHGDLTFVANRTSLIILRHFKAAAGSYDDINHAWSLEVDSVDYPILDATLVADDNTATGSIYYSMSADGGVHWESVTPGVKHYFANVGSDLRWMGELRASLYRSPYLYEIDIDYTYNESAITPTPTPTPTNTSTETGSFIGGFLSVSLAITTSFVLITIVRRRRKYSN